MGKKANVSQEWKNEKEKGKRRRDLKEREEKNERKERINEKRGEKVVRESKKWVKKHEIRKGGKETVKRILEKNRGRKEETEEEKRRQEKQENKNGM